jgi:transposase
LDIAVLPDGPSWSVTNDATGWIALAERLRDFSIAAIGLEASGGYERGVARALCAAGMSVRQVNPFKLRQFARASGVLAKNDPLDAKMIASFVAVMPTRPAQRGAEREQLAEMLAVRRQLSAEKVAAENASRLLEDAMLQRLSRRRIARLAADIALLDKRLIEIVTNNPALDRRYRLLTSMPGVGAVLACTLIAVMSTNLSEQAFGEALERARKRRDEPQAPLLKAPATQTDLSGPPMVSDRRFRRT